MVSRVIGIGGELVFQAVLLGLDLAGNSLLRGAQRVGVGGVVALREGLGRARVRFAPGRRLALRICR